ncbi:MAG: RidA family protein [Oscillibacter sp.]|nr:RidA family protein [Oscillibacter sp.]
MEKEALPIPQGKYVPANRCGNLIVTAGMTPRENGKLLYEGKIHIEDDLELYRSAVIQAAKNALNAAKSQLRGDERIQQILSITIYLNAEEGYTKHSKIADFASEYYCEQLGDAGIGCRVSVGVASLPGNAPCEIQIMAACG